MHDMEIALAMHRGLAWRQSGCLEWVRGGDGDGYGHFSISRPGLPRGAHRLAYELFVGPIPPGLTIDHLCRNRRCCNPAHLEPVPGAVNTLRGESVTAQNARKTHCVHGHALDAIVRHRSGGVRRACRTCKRDECARRRARDPEAFLAKARARDAKRPCGWQRQRMAGASNH